MFATCGGMLSGMVRNGSSITPICRSHTLHLAPPTPPFPAGAGLSSTHMYAAACPRFMKSAPSSKSTSRKPLNFHNHFAQQHELEQQRQAAVLRCECFASTSRPLWLWQYW